VRRTQLYLDEDLWNALHARARSAGTSISELVREAVRERYLGNLEKRREAMLAFVGTRKDWPETLDTEEYVRDLRKGRRIDRLGKQ
jgi:6-phosphogluconate dehydrogenase